MITKNRVVKTILSVTLSLPIFSTAAELRGDSALKTLTEIVSNHLVVLDRPLMVFRYDNIDYKQTTPLAIKSGLSRAAAKFYDTRSSLGKMAGPGLYTAVDPAVTRMDYGLNTPNLYAIILKTGTKLLDDRTKLFGEESVAFHRALKELNCSLIDAELGSLRYANNQKCLQHVFKIYKDLEISGVLYNFEASSSLVGCDPNRGQAINLIDGSAIDETKLSLYTNTRVVEANPNLRPFIQRLFEESALDSFLYLRNPTIPGIQTLSQTSKPEPTTYAEWKAANIWKCGPSRPGQRLPTDFQLESRHRYFSDDGFSTELRNFSKAAKKYFAGELLIPELRVFVKKQYENFGFRERMKYSEFLRMRSMLRNYAAGSLSNETKAQQVADLQKLLGEVLPTEKIVNSRKDIWDRESLKLPPDQRDVYFSNIGELGSMYLRMGFGARAATMLLNFSEEFPFLMKLVPAIPFQDSSAFMSANRKFVIETLRRCRDLYLDPTKTAAQIEASDCAFESP